ncbi:hypothetical protein [Pseudophaeobacter sp.]|jgi:hypothetical protein|uniref:hypothetical protein n=1 Tax=Pseudophaeobacter sp. TaxID=1971739 RepID=UPI0021F9B54C|nr:hypothetical protein [uncultured Pseudophaeobacter sp.]UWS78351.1 hypothetical protein N1037_13830 [Phaeobacter sp. G2]
MMVNEGMKKQTPVLGQIAPNPKLTLSAAFAVASVLSIPVFLLLSLVEWWFF